MLTRKREKRIKSYINFIQKGSDNIFKYKCTKCNTVSDEKSWIEQSMKSIGTTEDDIEPLSNIDFDNLEYNPHGYDCPNCLEVCFTDEEDIEKITC